MTALSVCRSRAQDRQRQIADFTSHTTTNQLSQHFAEIAAGLATAHAYDNADHLAHATLQSLQGRISNEQRRVNEATRAEWLQA